MELQQLEADKRRLAQLDAETKQVKRRMTVQKKIAANVDMVLAAIGDNARHRFNHHTSARLRYHDKSSLSSLDFHSFLVLAKSYRAQYLDFLGVEIPKQVIEKAQQQMLILDRDFIFGYLWSLFDACPTVCFQKFLKGTVDPSCLTTRINITRIDSLFTICRFTIIPTYRHLLHNRHEHLLARHPATGSSSQLGCRRSCSQYQHMSR